MTVKKIPVEGFDGLQKRIAEDPACKTDRLFVLFSGSVDAASGESWCPDCVAADPCIDQALKDVDDDLVLICCAVGDRATWKDQKNKFRTDPKLSLKGVPTLLNWHEPTNRLVEEKLQNVELIKMLFNSD